MSLLYVSDVFQIGSLPRSELLHVIRTLHLSTDSLPPFISLLHYSSSQKQTNILDLHRSACNLLFINIIFIVDKTSSMASKVSHNIMDL